MVSRAFDAVLFDFSGVMVSSAFDAMARLGGAAERERTLELLLGPYHEDTDHPWHRVERGELPIEAWVAEVSRTAASEGVEIDWSVMGSLLGDLEPYPQMEAEARRLRADGYRVGLVTNNVREGSASWRAMLPIDELFEVVVDSSEVGLRKPDPRIFLLALEQLGGVARAEPCSSTMRRATSPAPRPPVCGRSWSATPTTRSRSCIESSPRERAEGERTKEGVHSLTGAPTARRLEGAGTTRGVPVSQRRAGLGGSAALLGAGLLFGTTFVVMKDAIERAEVLPFLAVRFAVGALVLLPFALRRPSTREKLRVGLAAGACLLAGYLFQTVGLQYTSSTSSAFITYLLVVFVPIINALLTRRLPERSVVVAVVLSVTGLLLLSGGIRGFGKGELLTLGCALAFAVHILVLARTSHRYDPVRLTCWQIAVVSVACAGPGAIGGGYRFDAGVWAAAVFCGVAATALAFLGQVYGQRVVPASRAAILLLVEPVAAAVLGFVAGERLGWNGAIGAATILAGVIVAELGPRRPPALGAELALPD